ncbi:MAG TPA: response regulator, partial [Patescibacteria group bacterium]|nr:response regulator [Patescibacteria group bacterium]
LSSRRQRAHTGYGKLDEVRRHLLVADDDPLFVSLLTEVLGSAGYLVTSAPDGETALRMIEQAAPDLLILDLLLPRVDGWGVLKSLRAKAATRDLPILAVTSLGALDAERALALGANDYLSKPMSVSVLTDTVNRLIATAERRRREAEAERAAEQLLSAQSAAGEQTERVCPRILVVEDHPVNLELMVELLERGRYEIYTCGDGREVMRQTKAHRPDLVLLDINLPHIDGLTLARMLREDPETRSVTIVAISAYSVAGDEEQIRKAGCDGFIPKPIDTKSFLQTISTFLDRGTAR